MNSNPTMPKGMMRANKQADEPRQTHPEMHGPRSDPDKQGDAPTHHPFGHCFWTIRRVKSKWAKGLVDSGQRGAGHADMMRRYPSEESALLRVCEDIQRIATKERIDPSADMVAERKGSSVVVTVDPCGAVYVVRKVVGL